MRWIVWGAGSIGTRHLRNLLARGERDVLALRRREEPLGAELASVPVRTTLAEARGAHDAAVVICTPTASHVADAIAAVQAGCDVLVEKPLGDTLDQVDRLREAAARGGRIVGVAHCFRFHPTLLRVRDEVASGTLGRTLGVSVWCGQHLADWHPGEDHTTSYSARRDLGGGVLLDLSHETDYLQWLFGAAEAVSAMVRNTGALGIETEDVADMVVRLAGGVVASCHLDYLARPAVRGGWAVFERGALRWDLRRPSAERSAGQGWAPLAPRAGVTEDDMYVSELAAFAASVTSRTPFAVDLDAGARAVRLAIAAKDASARGREVTLR